ncbi:MAG: helix-turn-helix domain-containing protein [Methanothrix sp.]|nr:helix-turn-helix domain-containing protein [Methanothrix sp.]
MYSLIISYKYQMLPNKAILQKLAEALDACRWLYNNLLFQSSSDGQLHTLVQHQGTFSFEEKWPKDRTDQIQRPLLA